MSMRSPGFRSARAESPSPTRTLPASTSAWARDRGRDQPTVHEQLIEPDAPGGARRGHALIVAHAAHPGLTATGIPS